VQLTALARDAQEVLTYFGKGDVTLADARQVEASVILVLGQHLTRTLVTAARFIAERFADTPIVISGKRGRGTWLLDQAMTRHCLLHGRDLPTLDERRSEARLIERLLSDEGVMPFAVQNGSAAKRIHLEEQASHTEQNWAFSVERLRDFHLQRAGVILVVQADCNRRRSGETGRRILKRNGLESIQVLTLHVPSVDLTTLSERDMAIELYRTLGLKRSPASELRVCAEFEPAVLSGMPPPLRSLAEATERRWHEFLEHSPRMMDHFIGALANTPHQVGGREDL